MYKGNHIFSFILVLLYLGSGTIHSETKRKPMEVMMNRQLNPENRIQIGFIDQEFTSQHDYFERYQTLYINAEYLMYKNWSLYGLLPYTRHQEANVENSKRLDNIHFGTRADFRLGNKFKIGTGVDIELATGNDKKQSIGTSELGSIEPWLGLQYSKNWFWQTTLRYNAQTNKKFKEEENQEFNRTVLFDFAFGYRFKNIDILLEYNYKYRNDPKAHALNVQTLAPSIHYRVTDDMLLSFSIPTALTTEREWDYQLMLEFTSHY